MAPGNTLVQTADATVEPTAVPTLPKRSRMARMAAIWLWVTWLIMASSDATTKGPAANEAKICVMTM